MFSLCMFLFVPMHSPTGCLSLAPLLSSIHEFLSCLIDSLVSWPPDSTLHLYVFIGLFFINFPLNRILLCSPG